LAVTAARIGATRGHPAPEPTPDVAERIEAALDLVRGLPSGTPSERADLVDLVSERIGTRLVTYESVPAAIALAAAVSYDPWLACCLAASVGGDSDTIACMTGAIVGAAHGAAAFPEAAVVAVTETNPELGLEALAADLLALRGVA
jgi:ADP-ribosylglycohydrolase